MKLWNRIRWKMAGLWADESGMGVVEVILIIVVLIGLVIIFKTILPGDSFLTEYSQGPYFPPDSFRQFGSSAADTI